MNQSRDFIKFKVQLNDIEPAIWREIWVPARYSFWDLHVAIQDAMGWQDCHLHEFRLINPHTQEKARLGIPMDDDWDESITPLAGWEHSIADYMTKPGIIFNYDYDFGDGWEHTITCLGIEQRIKGEKYPKCVAGERACPPEDCGGVHGYQEILEIMLDPNHPEFDDNNNWLPEGWGPEKFDCNKVKFTNPKRRLNKLLEPA